MYLQRVAQDFLEKEKFLNNFSLFSGSQYLLAHFKLPALKTYKSWQNKRLDRNLKEYLLTVAETVLLVKLWDKRWAKQVTKVHAN